MNSSANLVNIISIPAIVVSLSTMAIAGAKKVGSWKAYSDSYSISRVREGWNDLIDRSSEALGCDKNKSVGESLIEKTDVTKKFFDGLRKRISKSRDNRVDVSVTEKQNSVNG